MRNNPISYDGFCHRPQLWVYRGETDAHCDHPQSCCARHGGKKTKTVGKSEAHGIGKTLHAMIAVNGETMISMGGFLVMIGNRQVDTVEVQELPAPSDTSHHGVASGTQTRFKSEYNSHHRCQGLLCPPTSSQFVNSLRPEWVQPIDCSECTRYFITLKKRHGEI